MSLTNRCSNCWCDTGNLGHCTYCNTEHSIVQIDDVKEALKIVDEIEAIRFEKTKIAKRTAEVHTKAYRLFEVASKDLNEIKSELYNVVFESGRVEVK